MWDILLLIIIILMIVDGLAVTTTTSQGSKPLDAKWHELVSRTRVAASQRRRHGNTKKYRDSTLIGDIMKLERSEAPRCCVCVDRTDEYDTCLMDTLVGVKCAKACGPKRIAWHDVVKRRFTAAALVRGVDSSAKRKNKVDMSCDLLTDLFKLGYDSAAAKFYHTIYPITQSVETSTLGEDVASVESRLSSKWHSHIINVMKLETEHFPFDAIAGGDPEDTGAATLSGRVPIMCSEMDAKLTLIASLQTKIQSIREDLDIHDDTDAQDDIVTAQNKDDLIERLQSDVFNLLQLQHDRKQKIINSLQSKIRELRIELGKKGDSTSASISSTLSATTTTTTTTSSQDDTIRQLKIEVFRLLEEARQQQHHQHHHQNLHHDA